MAVIKELIFCDDKPQGRTFVSADYCYDRSLFQIRTYKAGDQSRCGGVKQHIQIDKNMANEIIEKLQIFLEQ
jgi:hypothetical protein